jgi:hypothetical protein
MMRSIVGHRCSLAQQITGLENHPTRNGSETRELVVAHMRALRAVPCFVNARLVLVPEDNLGNEAQEIAEYALQTVVGVAVVARTETRYGVRTDQNVKRAYVFRFSGALAQSGIRYHEPLVSANPFITNRSPKDRALAARAEFERQLRSFQQVTALAPSLTSMKRVVYTGKADQQKKNTASLKDDMVMAALLGLYWAGEAVRGAVAMKSYASRLERVNAPHIAPVVRHEQYGGREFAERAATVVGPTPLASLARRLASEALTSRASTKRTQSTR